MTQADVLRPVLPALSDEIIEAIAHEVPGYRRAMKGTFGRVVRLGVETALGRFVDQLERPGADVGTARDTYVELGRGEYRAGRSLEALLGAYRLGARLAWRRFVEAGVSGGLEAETMYALGEQIFAYIDELSAASAEGYAAEQTRAAGEAERRRRLLVALLGSDPPAAGEAVRTAALDAGWSLPRTVAALVVAGEDESAEGVAARLGPDAIGAGDVVWIADPEAPLRAGQIARAVEQRGSLGPGVPLPAAGISLKWARAAFALGLDGVVRAEEHLTALLYAADPALAEAFTASRLAPLEELAPRTRARLAATLRAWLDRPGQVQAVAAALDVHPQTVRYRMRQLRELFGTRLEDPEARFELALALRVSAGRASG